MMLTHSNRFSVAPMIDWTDRYCRLFHRQISARARLYTEMIVDEAILRGDRAHLLDFFTEEHPVALQIGGSDPAKLAEAARIGADWGYDEINLNVGCPSDRVQSGRFGACLMREPDVVARAVEAMREAVPAEIPVTVKCRIGVDDQDPAEVLPAFLKTVEAAGAQLVIIHARKAWLQGLSPKENRTIPPLDYDLAAQMVDAFPALPIVLNGGITSLDQAEGHLETFAGVMIGRAAYEKPYTVLSGVDQSLFGATHDTPSRLEVLERFVRVLEQSSPAVSLARYARHLIGLFHGEPGARAWRQALTVEARQPSAGTTWLLDTARQIAARKQAPSSDGSAAA